jgi:hypothetical protein
MAPTINMRRRPIRSAWVVSTSETTHIARKRKREDKTALCFREPESDQVEHQNDRERAVREQPCESSDEEKPPVTSQGLERNRNQIGRHLSGVRGES